VNFLKQLWQNIRISMIVAHRKREVIKVAKLAHANELMHTPTGMWPEVQARHRDQIMSIKAGNLAIVDRRSWQFPFIPDTMQRVDTPVVKNTIWNIRKFARTPVARRAINMIKNSVLNMRWDIIPLETQDDSDESQDQATRLRIAKGCLQHPNNQDSFQSWAEMVLEDLLIYGSGISEVRLTPDPERPVKLWAVDSSTIRIFAGWQESDADNVPHYAQATGMQGDRAVIPFFDDELLIFKDNPATDTPFGTGKMEIAFTALQTLLGTQEAAGKVSADSTAGTIFWWQSALADSQYQRLRRYLWNEGEGQGKIGIIGGVPVPTTVTIDKATEADCFLNWQEMLMTMVADAFDLSAMALGKTNDVNRAVGQVLDDKDFRSAVVPIAKKLMEGLTRRFLHATLGWTDLQFIFLGMDDPDQQTLMTLLTQQYNCNALTSNEIRLAIGRKPSSSPFADLTQFEMIMLQAEATALAKPTPQPPQPGGGMGQDQSEGQSFQGAGLTKPTLKKLPTLRLSKTPIKGGKFNANQIANMSSAEIAYYQQLGSLPKKGSLLADAMDEQEPGILIKLSDEVQEYLATLIQLEEEEESAKEAKELSPNSLKVQKQALAKSRKRDKNRRNTIPGIITPQV
jgi:hypothetical protein